MKCRSLFLCLMLGLAVSAGCAEVPQVVTGSDPSVQFSGFHTFAFSGITDRGREVGASDTSPLRNRVKEIVHSQLNAKGVRQVGLDDRPDLLVHLFYGVKDMDRVEKTYPMQGFYTSQAKAYALEQGNWVPIPATRETTYEDHEGTLIVDLAKASDKKLVWRAIVRAVLGDNLEKNFALAQQGLAKAFKDYPPANAK